MYLILVFYRTVVGRVSWGRVRSIVKRYSTFVLYVRYVLVYLG